MDESNANHLLYYCLAWQIVPLNFLFARGGPWLLALFILNSNHRKPFIRMLG